MRGFQRVFGWAVVPLAVGASGCGASFQYGAQHAHFTLKPSVEVHTAVQFDMLSKPLHALACADPKAMYSVTVMGTTRGLSRGEQAAALEAIKSTAGAADVFLLTRSVGSFNDKGEACGEVWGRGLKLRSKDVSPDDSAAVPAPVAPTPAVELLPPPPLVPATAPATGPATPAGSSGAPAAKPPAKDPGKAKLGF
jgi:hypothetical protein